MEVVNEGQRGLWKFSMGEELSPKVHPFEGGGRCQPLAFTVLQVTASSFCEPGWILSLLFPQGLKDP